MAIEGDLRSLNITSVLQLISREKITGVLKVKKEPDIVDVGFVDSVDKTTSRLWCVFADGGPLSDLLCDELDDTGGSAIRSPHVRRRRWYRRKRSSGY